jgi:hypothetical protein
MHSALPGTHFTYPPAIAAVRLQMLLRRDDGDLLDRSSRGTHARSR